MVGSESRRQDVNMDPSCLVLAVQAGGGGVMVQGIVSTEHSLNSRDHLSMVADHIHHFLTKVYPSSDGYFQHHNIPCQKAETISNWLL